MCRAARAASARRTLSPFRQYSSGAAKRTGAVGSRPTAAAAAAASAGVPAAALWTDWSPGGPAKAE